MELSNSPLSARACSLPVASAIFHSIIKRFYFAWVKKARNWIHAKIFIFPLILSNASRWLVGTRYLKLWMRFVMSLKKKKNLGGFWFKLDMKWKISGNCLVWIQNVTGTSPTDNKELESFSFSFPSSLFVCYFSCTLKPVGSIMVISSDHFNVTEFHPEIPLLQHFQVWFGIAVGHLDRFLTLGHIKAACFGGFSTLITENTSVKTVCKRVGPVKCLEQV